MHDSMAVLRKYGLVEVAIFIGINNLGGGGSKCRHSRSVDTVHHSPLLIRVTLISLELFLKLTEHAGKRVYLGCLLT